MRKTRFASLAASAALASATILGGAGLAQAQSSSEPEMVDSAEIVMKAGGEDDGEGRYTLSATAYDNCTVAFELEDNWPGEYTPNWRADYRVGKEKPVMPGSSRGENTYRPVLGSHDGIEEAIENRGDKAYDFDTGQVTVDLTEPRTVPQYDDPSDVTERPGVEPNQDGTHEITFGVYQGPNTAAHNEYSFNTSVTVEGCPTTDDGGLLGSVVGSVDVFGSLENFS